MLYKLGQLDDKLWGLVEQNKQYDAKRKSFPPNGMSTFIQVYTGYIQENNKLIEEGKAQVKEIISLIIDKYGDL